MIFNKGKKYVFSKDVYLASDERVENLSNDQINKYDGKEVKVGHSYLGYIGNSRISFVVNSPIFFSIKDNFLFFTNLSSWNAYS